MKAILCTLFLIYKINISYVMDFLKGKVSKIKLFCSQISSQHNQSQA